MERNILLTISIETKIREFQYKILNNIMFTNEKLFRLKLTESPLCAFCNQETESVEHIYFLLRCNDDFLGSSLLLARQI